MSAADIHGDGVLGSEDVVRFLAAFEDGSLVSDFNTDGYIDFTDFDGFVSAFEGN